MRRRLNFFLSTAQKPSVRTIVLPFKFASLRAITSETDASSHYFFHTAHNLTDTAERQEEFTDTCADALVFAFHQDKTLIAEQMKRAPRGGRGSDALAQVSFLGDTTPMLGRRMIRNLIAAERESAS